MSKDTVLLTDRAWPDDVIERSVIDAAGYRLVAGPAEAASPSEIEQLVQRHRPSAILTCWAPVSDAAIAASPNLRIVARLGVGLDNIAVEAASSAGVLVTNVPDYCVEEVSDHAVALVLAWTRGIVRADRAVQGGQWDPATLHLRRLSTLTCGVVGFGRIGRKTCQKLRGLGANVVASDPHPPADTDGTPVLVLDELLTRSDVVILHAPLTPSTHHLIGRREFASMPPGGMLVNVSRGGLVDTDALIEALDSGQLDAAGLDVLESEPQVPAALRVHPGVVITPHIAFSSDSSVEDLRRSAAEEVVRVLRGEPARHACNFPAAVSTPGGH